MNRNEILIAILYRVKKNAVSLMERDLGCGVAPVEPEIEKVYQQHKTAVAEMERRFGCGKTKGTS